MVDVIELFSGIGAQTAALKRANIPHNVVGIAEIDPYAIKSYEAVHGKTRNFGDITQIDALPAADLWTVSSPCQDLSVAGNLKGMSGDRSSLIWEIPRLLRVSPNPSVLLFENVANFVSERFRPQFDRFFDVLRDEFGYIIDFSVLNAKDYGVPQKRKRVYVIARRADVPFAGFPQARPLERFLYDILQPACEVDSKYQLKGPISEALIEKCLNSDVSYCIDANYHKGAGADGDVFLNRGRRQLVCIIQNGHGFNKGGVHDVSPTVTSSGFERNNFTFDGRIVRKLTPLECWRLMGFDDADFNSAKAAGVSNTQLYKQAGNSIVVDVLVALFERIYK